MGSEVSHFCPGDAVWYTPQIFGSPGSYAEFHVADESIVAHKPDDLSHTEAASLSLVGGTVWEALVTRAELRVGETILIHGGAGGVGHVVIQVARAMGARVITTVSARDLEFAKSLGADLAIDYRSDDYVDLVLESTGGKGVDVILDTIGGDTLARSPYALNQLGRVISIVSHETQEIRPTASDP